MPNQESNQETGNRVRMTETQLEDIVNMIMSMDAPEEVKREFIERLRSGDASVVQDIMSAAAGYPATPLVFGPEVKFKLGIIAAIKRFKKKKTHNRTSMERLAAMRELARDLSLVYQRDEVKVTAVCLVDDETADSRGSFYHRKTDTIVMVEKLSIITLLHEFAHALGKDEVGAVRWSLTLFKRVWPEQFDRLQPDGHTLVMPNGEAEDNDEAVVTSPAANPIPETPEGHVPTDEEEEVLALLEEEGELDDDEDDGEWMDEHFDDEDDEDEVIEEEEAPAPPRRRRTTKKDGTKPKPKKKVKKPAKATAPKRKPKKRR